MKPLSKKVPENAGLTFEDVKKAHEAIKDATIRTPTVKAARLSAHLGIDLYLKLENLQHTNAFKGRGALNKLLSLNEEQRKKGVIALSRGNHAQGVAYHAQRLNIPTIIVMPEGTPFNKIKRTEDFGAKVVIHGADLVDSAEEVQRLIKEHGYTYIHPFDDPLIAAGQGTLGIEMLEDVPDLDVVFVPVGGGGLISGVATALKGMKPDIEVIGVQAENFPGMVNEFHDRPFVPGEPTIAEGIAVEKPAASNVETVKALVSDMVTASENEIEEGIFDVLSDEKLVIEGAPAAGYAYIKKNADKYKGKKIGLVVCGGNIDSRLLSTIILRGLVRDGRITRLTFEIDDTPGQLSDISRIIGESGANVVEVIHQRMMQSVSLKRAELEVVIEARDKQHVQDIVQTLEDAGFSVKASSDV